MKEQLIEFDTAKLAKKKGFDNIWGIRGGYLEDGTYKHLKYYEDSDDLDYYGPTQSLLQKWLRDEKGIMLWVSPMGELGMWCYKWICDKDKIDEKPSFGGAFVTYEEALEKGILKALRLTK